MSDEGTTGGYEKLIGMAMVLPPCWPVLANGGNGRLHALHLADVWAWYRVLRCGHIYLYPDLQASLSIG